MEDKIEIPRMQSSRKGQKALRNKPLYYDEKKEKFNLTLTPSVKEKIKARAKQEGYSASELIECIVRGGILEKITLVPGDSKDADENL